MVKSEVVEDNQSPVWETASAIFYRSDPAKAIKVQIWNSNLVVDSFMGQGLVMAQPLQGGAGKASSEESKSAVVTERLELFGRKSKKAESMPGRVTVEIESFDDLSRL